MTCPNDTTPANVAINRIPRVFVGKLGQSMKVETALFRLLREETSMVGIIGELVHKTSVALARPFHGPHNLRSANALYNP